MLQLLQHQMQELAVISAQLRHQTPVGVQYFTKESVISSLKPM
jgi:hypothetical protein